MIRHSDRLGKTPRRIIETEIVSARTAAAAVIADKAALKARTLSQADGPRYVSSVRGFLR